MSDLSPLRHARPAPADLMSPATQIVGDRSDYLGDGSGEVGRRIGEDRLELFVTCDPALAMQQQFTSLAPDFIALHDVGASSSLRLLSAIAGAVRGKLQQLSIRRQGHGVALATLRFVELPGAGKTKLRIYTTDVDTDSNSRRQLAAVLLGHSRLGVLMVGDLPSHALQTALQPLRDAIKAGPWPNRNLLLLPMGSSAALAAQASSLAGSSGVHVRVTPTAARPNDAWNYITGAWNRLRGGAEAAESQSLLSSAPAPAPVAPVAPVAQRPQAAPAPAPAPTPAYLAPTEPMPLPDAAGDNAASFDEYLRQCAAIKGLLACCVFDLQSRRSLGHSGGKPDAGRLTTQGLALYGTMVETGRTLGLGQVQPDAAIHLGAHHLLLHPLPNRPGKVLHAVLDAGIANITLARMQLQRIDTNVLGAPMGGSR